MILKQEYDAVMEHLQVTPDMRRRVLEHIRQADLSPRAASPSGRRRALAAAACLALLAAGAAVLPLLPSETEPEPPVLSVPDIALYASASDLAQAVGFPVEDLSALPFQPEQTTYLSYWGELAQIQYTAGEASAVYRKSAGEQDDSGDYTPYSAQTQLQAGSRSVTLKGDDTGYVLALWSDGGFSYSIRLSLPLEPEAWLPIIASAI